MFKLTTNFQITTRAKINFNGQEYGSVDDMPPEVRDAYEKAMASISQTKLGTVTQTRNRIVVNGQEYQSVDEMPPDVRRVYEELIANTRNLAAEAARTGQSKLVRTRWTVDVNPEPGGAPAERQGLPALAPAAATQRPRRSSGKIWSSAILGTILLVFIIAYGGRFHGKDTLALDSPWALLLLIPGAFFLHAIYTAFRGEHCPHCGTALPTRQGSSAGRQCPKCRRELDLP